MIFNTRVPCHSRYMNYTQLSQRSLLLYMLCFTLYNVPRYDTWKSQMDVHLEMTLISLVINPALILISDCCKPEVNLDSWLPIRRIAKTLIRLGRCPG